MSKLLITKADVRKAIVQYYEDYRPEIFKQYDFENTQWYVGGHNDNLADVQLVVEEK